jgi:hypothetical protein
LNAERELSLDPRAGLTRVASCQELNRLRGRSIVTQRANQRRTKSPNRRNVEWKLACLSANTIGTEEMRHRSIIGW